MQDFFRHNARCQDVLHKITGPLKQNFGIDVFGHQIAYENGHLSNVCNYHEMWAHFWDSGCYKDAAHYVAPSCLTPGYFHLDSDKQFEKILSELEKKHPLHHVFIIIRKEGPSKAHIFGFAAKEQRPNLPSFYSNNIPLLNSYIDYYLKKTAKFKTSSEDNMVNLAELKGKKLFYNKSYGLDCLPQPERHAEFLKQIGVSPFLFTAAKTLSRREKEALNACYEHKTAKEHAQALGISSRTVEYHLENARNKLGIFTRDRLLENVRLLKMAGLLD